MSDREHSEALLELAERDLRALEAMGSDPAFADEIVGFHAQQAVEKALKAWLTVDGHAYDRTHDLGALLGALDSVGHDVSAFRSLIRLNVFAVRFRYESLGPGAPFPGRGRIGGDIRAVIDHVRAYLGSG